MQKVRTFLINKIPEDISSKKTVTVKTGFLVNSTHRDVIISQRDKRYSLSVNNMKNGTKDKEYEIPLSHKDFHTLWPATIDSRVEFKRRTILRDDIMLEIHTYSGHLSGLITGKIRAVNQADSSPLPIPRYFNEELTFDSRFTTRNLSTLDYGDISETLSLGDMKHYPLMGTLPYIIEEGMLKVMVVSTRSNNGWIFPKGQPIIGKSEMEVALLEAYEEAGIRGTITGNPIVVPYLKKTGIYSMILYPMAITSVLKRWPEESERSRALLTPREAGKKMKQQGMKSALGWLEYLREYSS